MKQEENAERKFDGQEPDDENEIEMRKNDGELDVEIGEPQR